LAVLWWSCTSTLKIPITPIVSRNGHTTF
jgi:hypothetical protein